MWRNVLLFLLYHLIPAWYVGSLISTQLYIDWPKLGFRIYQSLMFTSSAPPLYQSYRFFTKSSIFTAVIRNWYKMTEISHSCFIDCPVQWTAEEWIIGLPPMPRMTNDGPAVKLIQTVFVHISKWKFFDHIVINGIYYWLDHIKS